MKEAVLAWLNGSQDYITGVALYRQYGHDKHFIEQLSRPEDKLLKNKLFYALKSLVFSNNNTVAAVVPGNVRNTASSVTVHPPTEHTDTPLATAAKSAANTAYKDMMNTRALLLNLCPVVDSPDLHTKAAKMQRAPLVQRILEKDKDVNELFDRYRFIEKHGYDPDESDTGSPDPVDLHRLIANLKKKISRIEQSTRADKALALEHAKNTLNKLQNEYEAYRKS